MDSYFTAFSNVKMYTWLTGHSKIIKFASSYQWTPLHLAAWNGRVETAQLLVEKGADINVETDDWVRR